jgi:riboflavin kinase
MEDGEAELTLRGRRVPGLGVGGRYISHPYYQAWFEKLLGCKPYPGTLNLETSVDWRQLAARCVPKVIPETTWEGRRLGAVYVWEARVKLADTTEEAEAALIRPLLSKHPANVLEIVACERLGDRIGEEVEVIVACMPNPDYTKPPKLPGRGEKQK